MTHKNDYLNQTNIMSQVIFFKKKHHIHQTSFNLKYLFLLKVVQNQII